MHEIYEYAFIYVYMYVYVYAFMYVYIYVCIHTGQELEVSWRRASCDFVYEQYAHVCVRCMNIDLPVRVYLNAYMYMMCTNIHVRGFKVSWRRTSFAFAHRHYEYVYVRCIDIHSYMCTYDVYKYTCNMMYTNIHVQNLKCLAYECIFIHLT